MRRREECDNGGGHNCNAEEVDEVVAELNNRPERAKNVAKVKVAALTKGDNCKECVPKGTEVRQVAGSVL